MSSSGIYKADDGLETSGRKEEEKSQDEMKYLLAGTQEIWKVKSMEGKLRKQKSGAI